MRAPSIPYVRRVRRNHALEHATVHVLSGRRPGIPLAGRSDGGGFWLYGDVETEDVRAAATTALARLPSEPQLAIHPYCGTNLVVGGLLAAAAALAALLSTAAEDRARKPLSVLPRLLLAGTAAAVASRPLGPWAQRRLTTHPDVAGARIGAITLRRKGRHRLHRVEVGD